KTDSSPVEACGLIASVNSEGVYPVLSNFSTIIKQIYDENKVEMKEIGE
ncbi:12448_t:CDS:1, partial [Racocetra persica]